MHQAPVVIVEYDARWPGMFEEESTRIRSVLGDKLVALEHVGSTAVPGLVSKPIIDILAGVRSLADATRCIGWLSDIGYEYHPKHEAELPGRRYFDKGSTDGRTHHLHMVEVVCDFWERHLLFRDYLRSHPEGGSGVREAQEKIGRRVQNRPGGVHPGQDAVHNSDRGEGPVSLSRLKNQDSIAIHCSWAMWQLHMWHD